MTETTQKGADGQRRRDPAARRARPAGRPERARGAVPDPFRPDLRLPAHDARQQARRGGPDDADLPAHARVDRQVPLPVRAVLGLALPDRPQPLDGPLPREPALAAGGGGARARRLGGALGRGGGAPLDRPPVDARADRLALAGAAAGADAEVRLQLLERRGGDDPRQDRGRREVAPAPRARLAPEADLGARRRRAARWRSRSGSSGFPERGRPRSSRR